FAVAILLAGWHPAYGAPVEKIPGKLIVLTFDDAVKSHRTFVAPLLKELGFGATFFVTHKWMDDRTNFMTWQDIAEINELGYEIARRGEQPEAHYGTLEFGATYDPKRHHPLLIPTTGDAYPNWTLEHFQQVVARATNGQAVVLQFHGSPDIAHPWVHTPPE